MAASLLILIVFGVWYYKTLQPYIPNDLTTVDPAAMQQLLQNATGQITANESHMLIAFEAALTALWLYGCIDAYLVSKNKGRT